MLEYEAGKLRRAAIVVDRDRRAGVTLDLPLVGERGTYREAGHAWLAEVVEVRLLADGYALRLLKLRTVRTNPSLRAAPSGRCFTVFGSYASSDKGWSFEPERHESEAAETG